MADIQLHTRCVTPKQSIQSSMPSDEPNVNKMWIKSIQSLNWFDLLRWVHKFPIASGDYKHRRLTYYLCVDRRYTWIRIKFHWNRSHDTWKPLASAFRSAFIDFSLLCWDVIYYFVCSLRFTWITVYSLYEHWSYSKYCTQTDSIIVE